MDKPEWYTDAQKYWNGVTPTIDGMLGGFAVIDPVDVKGSLDFIHEYVYGKKGVNNTVIKEPVMNGEKYACDCGAGIGRVTKNFLLNVPFEKVDLVEQAPSFVEQAKSSYLAKEIEENKIGNIFCQGLQDFTPEEGKYDLIWCQWVLGHLTDDHFVEFFKRCVRGLKPNGLIGVKENNAKVEAIVDDEDSSVTRTNNDLKTLFTKAGLTLIKEELQQGLPSGLFAVRMYMLKPTQK
ncbi:alpha-N-methyltransferase NTM1 [Cokeromyces recurvatus]|uniref:alpha-N-methyltransferase NTM1 n=1 Tax=Cokeromyces recurvatus TaxID=90255 RepID=UPI002220F678|nr:alpha-N-methyltransferase NTM1 [Cokeromyces recurvatus]KAI7907420.1 alpha-N-methyltransferase NTM1 [Cokeromyces recurvatus]